MAIEVAMQEALGSRPDAVAVACMDTGAGLMLGMEVRSDVPRGDVEAAAYSAAELCSAPALLEDGEQACEESFVASTRWVHVYARIPHRRELVVVGIAPGEANIALLRVWIRQLAERVGPQV